MDNQIPDQTLEPEIENNAHRRVMAVIDAIPKDPVPVPINVYLEVQAAKQREAEILGSKRPTGKGPCGADIYIPPPQPEETKPVPEPEAPSNETLGDPMTAFDYDNFIPFAVEEAESDDTETH